MILLVGLGNPGTEYQTTRHNAGWMFLDYLSSLPDSDFEEWKEKKKLNSFISEGSIELLPERNEVKSKEYSNVTLRQAQRVKVILAKPTTFMNNSGRAVQKLTNHYSRTTNHLIIVHDDIDIPFGEFKIQTNRGSAGHHGVESIISHLGTRNFTRIRIGISPIKHFDERNKTARADDHVLKRFLKAEQNEFKKIFQNIFGKLAAFLSAK